MSGRVVRLDPPAHKVADALLPWYVNGTLDRDERAFVESHLADCPRCRQEVEWLRGLYAACVAGEKSAGASNAFRKLRLRLEAPQARPRFPSGTFAARRRPWTHWLIGAQLAVIAGLGVAWLGYSDRMPAYRTLGAASIAAEHRASIVVVFDPTVSEAELRWVLREAGARIVDGPTQTNAYLLDVPREGRERALQALRSEPAVSLVEDLAPTRAR